jgi:tetratricopeptide (TPR) repeat protein
MNEIGELIKKACRLKLHALNLRALDEITNQWEYVVDFRNSANLYLKSIPDITDKYKAISYRLEAMGLFIDAKDPIFANTEWDIILKEISKDQSMVRLASRMKKKIKSVMEEYSEYYNQNIKTKIEDRTNPLGSISIDDISQFTLRYPGCPLLWYFYYRVAIRIGNLELAESNLRKARTLWPDRPPYSALLIALLINKIDRDESFREIITIHAEWDNKSVEVLFFYTLALLYSWRQDESNVKLFDESIKTIDLTVKLSEIQASHLYKTASGLQSHMTVLHDLIKNPSDINAYVDHDKLRINKTNLINYAATAYVSITESLIENTTSQLLQPV